MTYQTFGNLGSIPEDIKEHLVWAGNNALTDKTWKQYQGVRKHILECAKATGMSTDFPFSTDQVYTLVGFWLSRKNLKSRTVSSYLSALRMLHIVEGFPDVTLRTGYSIPGVVAKKQQREERGTVVKNPANAKVAKGPVCLSFNKRDGHCSRTTTTDGCRTDAGREFLHLCAMVKHVDGRGVPVLCGEKHSAARGCSHKK